MSGVNRAIVVGHLGADPEIRQTQSGGKIAAFSLATGESWKDKATGERRERTEWHRIVIYNEALAKVAEQYLHKGSKVYLEGAMHTRKWTDGKGIERFTTEVTLGAPLAPRWSCSIAPNARRRLMKMPTAQPMHRRQTSRRSTMRFHSEGETMTGHLRIMVIEAEGDAVNTTIEAALAIFTPSNIAPPIAAPALAAAAAKVAALPAPAAKPRASSATKPAKRASKPAKSSAAAVNGASGVDVADNVVSFKGKSITVTAREAQLACELAKVMPNIGDRNLIAQALWRRTDSSALTMVGQVARALNESVAAIGLKVTAVRGIGVCMAET